MKDSALRSAPAGLSPSVPRSGAEVEGIPVEMALRVGRRQQRLRRGVEWGCLAGELIFELWI